MKKTYRGKIDQHPEWWDVILIGNDGDSLGEMVSADRESFGEYASVRYFICAQDVPEDAIMEAHLRHLYGDIEAGQTVLCGSEWTGVYYMGDDLKVGGHDLIAEIQSHIGMYLHLEIEFSKTPKEFSPPPSAVIPTVCERG